MTENLIITIDASSGIGLHARIHQSIVELILDNSVLPGDKLPSSRDRSGYVVSYEAPTTRLVDTPGVTEPQ